MTAATTTSAAPGALLGQLDDGALRQLADFFGLFAVPLRLRILSALRGGARNVSALTAELGCSQANVSKHLATLAANGLVAKEARGTSAYYRIADPRIFRLCDLVCSELARGLARRAEAGTRFVAGPRRTPRPVTERAATGAQPAARPDRRRGRAGA